MGNVEISYKNNKIEMIDLLKSFSIFTIVLMHLVQMYMSKIPDIIVKASSIGGTGVHIFFLISGIGLYLSFLKKKICYTDFLKKRFGKIYIPYIGIIIISFFIPFMYTGNDKLIALLSHVFLFKMFIPRYECSFGTHFWFISTIIQFYLLAVPLFKLKEILKNKKFCCLCFSISFFWWITCYYFKLSDRIFVSCFLQYLWEFSLGIVIADYFNKKKYIKLNKTLIIIIAIPCLIIQYIMTLIPGFKIFNDIPGMIGYLFLAITLMDIKPIKIIISSMFKNSYEIYLTHILILTIIFRIINPSSFLSEVICAFISIIACIIIANNYKKIINYLINKK